MTVADTSVAVAGFAGWHVHHAAAIEALEECRRLVAHCAFETYSVLTRLPGHQRASALLVRDFLEKWFPEPLLALDTEGCRALLRDLPERDIRGGATYDALVGATARRARATLLTLDRRAIRTYRVLEVDFRLIGP